MGFKPFLNELKHLFYSLSEREISDLTTLIVYT
nr:MAG TPA: hypothetical protein [Caudoviricetes sp.]